MWARLNQSTLNWGGSTADAISRLSGTSHTLPVEGELVFCVINRVISHGAYAKLEEYRGLEGFLHISEVASGRVKQIERYVRPQQKVVLKVIRVDPARHEVDLSLKQVSREEWRKKLVEVKKAEKAKAILLAFRNKLGWNDDKVAWLMDSLSTMALTPYDALVEFVKRGFQFLSSLNLTEQELNVLMQESKARITPTLVEVRGVVEIRIPTTNGIEVIKNTLLKVIDSEQGQNVKVHYLGAPKYLISVSGENYKVAEKIFADIIEKLKSDVEGHGGVFSFKREEAPRG